MPDYAGDQSYQIDPLRTQDNLPQTGSSAIGKYLRGAFEDSISVRMGEADARYTLATPDTVDLTELPATGGVSTTDLTPQLRPNPLYVPSPIIAPADLKAQYGLNSAVPMRQIDAESLHDRNTADANRQRDINNAQNGFIKGLGWTLGTAASMADPATALMYAVPILGEARLATALAGTSRLGRIGIHAGELAAQGALGTTINVGLDAGLSATEGRDFSMREGLKQIMFGTAIGGTLGGLVGSFSKPVQKLIDGATPATKQAMLNEALDAIQNGRTVRADLPLRVELAKNGQPGTSAMERGAFINDAGVLDIAHPAPDAAGSSFPLLNRNGKSRSFPTLEAAQADAERVAVAQTRTLENRAAKAGEELGQAEQTVAGFSNRAEKAAQIDASEHAARATHAADVAAADARLARYQETQKALREIDSEIAKATAEGIDPTVLLARRQRRLEQVNARFRPGDIHDNITATMANVQSLRSSLEANLERTVAEHQTQREALSDSALQTAHDDLAGARQRHADAGANLSEAKAKAQVPTVDKIGDRFVVRAKSNAEPIRSTTGKPILFNSERSAMIFRENHPYAQSRAYDVVPVGDKFSLVHNASPDELAAAKAAPLHVDLNPSRDLGSILKENANLTDQAGRALNREVLDYYDQLRNPRPKATPAAKQAAADSVATFQRSQGNREAVDRPGGKTEITPLEREAQVKADQVAQIAKTDGLPAGDFDGLSAEAFLKQGDEIVAEAKTEASMWQTIVGCVRTFG